MEMKKISEIVIPEYRQRKELNSGAVAALRESIKVNTLMHPIVLRDGNILVAGENRIRAIEDAHFLGETVRHGTQTIPPGYIPTVDLGTLTELQSIEAELEENVRRTNLTWQEEAQATERLHSLRVRQAEAKGYLHTAVDTAEEIRGVRGGKQGQVISHQLLFVRNAESVPEAAKAKTVEEAVKIIKRAEDKLRYAEIGAAIEKEEAEGRHTLIHGDSLSVLCGEEHTGKYDVILSDPPYGMGADNFGDSGSADRCQAGHMYSDSYENWLDLMGRFIPLTIQVTKPQSHLYLFCDFDRFAELRTALLAIGWKVFRTPIILNKIGNSGRLPWPKHGPRRQYELVLFAQRGDKLVNHIGTDVIESPLVPERMGHPAEKSVPALSNLLARSANAGDKILDPFCGCGPIFEAVHKMGGYCTGIEQDPAFYGMAVKRKGELL